MSEPQALDAQALCWRCDPQQFEFQTTRELEDLRAILGQARATTAINFGLEIRKKGFNIYALGPTGLGKRSLVEEFAKRKAAAEEPPVDWCYVHNFEQPHRPRILQLPTGRGYQFRQEMDDLIEDLRSAIPAALESDEFRGRVQALQQEFVERREQEFAEVSEKAAGQEIQLIRTPGGFALAPLHEGEVLGPDEFEKLPKPEQERIQQAVASLENEIQALLSQLPQWRKEVTEKIKNLKREVTRLAIGHSLKLLKEKNTDLPQLAEYFEAVERDVIEHAEEFHRREEGPMEILGIPAAERPSLHRYQVNLLVDNRQTQGGPVVEEHHPSFQNLVGRIDHRSHMGSLVTDFTLIKPGALHRANGGYLVLDMLKLLRQPFAWEALKRCLVAKEIKIESLGESLSLISSDTLEPEPMPLDVKVVVLGDRLLYYLLYEYDPEFSELFKVAADFDERMDRSAECCRLYAQFIASLARREKLRPADRSAVARVLEYSARVAEDSEKLSTHMRTIAELLCEADHWAGDAGAELIAAEHVQRAIDQQDYRSDRLRERVQEEIQLGTFLIDTDGEQVGQVNGLSVLDLGGFRFGRPSRITATARLGKGEVIDVEREVELGGAIHSKGVFILSSFMASRYAQNQPLSLTANLVFEQSYGMIEGDSASVAELCALLSALANLPLKQSMAVTGSVNQHGQVQAIGGVNEKIEGFFDVCQQRGLNGQQAVLIPRANVRHLMLRHDVIQAAAEGKFRVFPVETVDEAITLLSGVAAGTPDPQGEYPEGTVNYQVMQRLRELTKLRQQYAQGPSDEKAND
ncbi:MAG: AAA family ATPase [Planctomycetales bacterium]|nr:AAA family ATPase [Planctomycetales bacterium]NIM08201.1 AAA family ATPase [Planctomycetales bacterium]NIN07695.1 AAA family ATPase [Planctomycetales bacterium]NIN76821.1 AAA family ATPase [Planctomycetales bacterium]NIO34017.1 AAA family ATPase [Planctomycetales bacterium]